MPPGGTHPPVRSMPCPVHALPGPRPARSSLSDQQPLSVSFQCCWLAGSAPTPGPGGAARGVDVTQGPARILLSHSEGRLRRRLHLSSAFDLAVKTFRIGGGGGKEAPLLPFSLTISIYTKRRILQCGWVRCLTDLPWVMALLVLTTPIFSLLCPKSHTTCDSLVVPLVPDTIWNSYP